MSLPSRWTLEDYFRTETSPSRGVDIVKLWEALFHLLDELKEVHSSGTVYSNIKPDNVIVVKDTSENHSQWRFEFENDDVGVRTRPMHSRERSGYDAPEIYMFSEHSNGLVEAQSRVCSSVDIWALGCIYSEAAIWIADGYAGLQDFRYQREIETSALLSIHISLFHDGTQVLQSVLNAHADIEERLRRSDNITKNVLDKMVQEMLWEEDRPSAKALLRKVEIVLTEARQKSAVGSGSRSEMARLRRGQKEYPPPNFPSPTQPLPPVPQRAAPGLDFVPGRKMILEAESVPSRDQISISQSRANSKENELTRLNHPVLRKTVYDEAVLDSNRDRDMVRAFASWDISDEDSAKQPPIPFKKPYRKMNNSRHKPTPNQGRPRALRVQEVHSARLKVEHPQKQASEEELHARHTALPTPNYPPPEAPSVPIATFISHTCHAPSNHGPHDIVPARADSVSSNHHSTTSSQRIRSLTGQDDSFLDALSYIPTADEISSPTTNKSTKRGGGFSLFPTRSRNESSTRQRRMHDMSIPQSPSLSSAAEKSNLEYISLNTCLEWKKANKKVKKHANVPPLLSESLMEELRGRDHAFIIDDSASMTPVWADVQRVFEALSYVVKGMSPEGTELFFTISYDTYRRKDTSELCTRLSTHPLKGQTDIVYRLNLQLQAYRLKLLWAKTSSKTKNKKPTTAPLVPAKVRPLSMYILTNGKWGVDSGANGGVDEGVEEVRELMRTMREVLRGEGLDVGQVGVQFVSFGGNAGATRRMGGLVRENIGNMGLALDCERWTGNVVRMLGGALGAHNGEGAVEGMISQLG